MGGKGLLGDQGGAIMIIGVFMAVLLVGLLYYVMGIGQTVLYREQMQDAADTAAFGAAVMHARGMNILAYLNIVMAAFATVAAALDVVTSSIELAMAYATIVCAASEGTSDACDYIETYADEAEEAADAADEAESDVEDLLELLHRAAVAVREGVPLAAQAKVQDYTGEPPVEFGFMTPVGESLPAEDDDSDWPCEEKIAPVAANLAALGLVDYTMSVYLLLGYATGRATATEHAKEWCDDDYFQRVLEDAEMGDGHFQIRAVVVGDPPFDETRAGVAVATWGEDEAESAAVRSLGQLGRVAVAQAELYFDGDVEREEWLWNMRWRARLRRVHFESGASVLGEGCRAIGGRDCTPLSAVGDLDGLFVH